MNKDPFEWNMGKGAERRAKHHSMRQAQRAELVEYYGKTRQSIDTGFLVAILQVMWQDAAVNVKIVRKADTWAPVVNRGM